ncbi:N-acetylmuramoyl-L-alanine amidase [uncultured Roseovarius sp.]|uniref:N-acetylmuramoyl-L-alanine amidase n=1 Tax=uncultured Roseovarius sp. TaxID=293344 RepID=UPI002624BE54|nr:N-acetylmuramoyl-L-alanine amidase [uncultured Roseovarius sp.]
MIVLHYTAMRTAEAALARLCDPEAEVSAHYLISGTGEIWHLVEEHMRAWHAGAGKWGSVCDVNSRSIGIELANGGTHPFSEPQVTALERLLGDVMTRWQIRPERVIAHSDLAPARKSDPGPKFDWRRLARRGLSIWSDVAGAVYRQNFLRDAERFGYRETEDVNAAHILHAFRLRFRPGASGPLCDQDCAIMEDLAARFPVDRIDPSA